MPYNVLSTELKNQIWLMYLRKSRQDNPDETVEEVLAKHESILQEWAMRELGYEIPEECIFREVISGESLSERQEAQKLLARIEDPNVAGVVCVDPQRLSRGDLMDCGTLINTLMYTRTLVATPMMTYDLTNKMERRFFQDELMRGRDYLDYVKEVLARGRYSSVINKGNFIGSVAPYGYDKITIGKDHTLTPNEIEADVVRMIFDWYVNEGMTTGAIARKLTTMGIKPRSKDVWFERTIYQILGNPHYDGKVAYYRRKTEMQVKDGKQIKRRTWQPSDQVLMADGKHPAIIDHDTFMKAQEKRYNAPRVSKDLLMKNPLAGLIFCSKCGHNFIRQPYSHAEDRMGCRYNRPLCMKSAKISDIKANLIQALERAELPALREKLNNGEGKSVAIQKRLLEKLEAQMEEYIKQEDKQYDLLETGVYTQDKFVQRHEALLQKMEDCKKQIYETRSSMPKEVDYAERIVTLEKAIEALKNDEIPCDVQNKLLHKIIERIEITTYPLPKRNVGMDLKIFLRL